MQCMHEYPCKIELIRMCFLSGNTVTKIIKVEDFI